MATRISGSDFQLSLIATYLIVCFLSGRALASDGAMDLPIYPRLVAPWDLTAFAAELAPAAPVNPEIVPVVAQAGSAQEAPKDSPSPATLPQPHWSGLPIWSAEAEAKGYQVPLPFGIGATFYDARQPVNLLDLQLARDGIIRYR